MSFLSVEATSGSSCHACSLSSIIVIDGSRYCSAHLVTALEDQDFYVTYDRGECDNCSQNAMYCEECNTNSCNNCGNGYIEGCNECISEESTCDGCGDPSEVLCDSCQASKCVDCGTTGDDAMCSSCRDDSVMCAVCGDPLNYADTLCPKHTPVKLPEAAVIAAESGVTVGDIEFRFSN